MFEAISMVNLLALLAQTEPTGWLQNNSVFIPLLLAAVVGGYFLAKTIASSLTLNDYGGRMAVVLVSVLVGGLVIAAQWPPRFGVDLRGGINMVGSMNVSDIPEAERPKPKDIIPTLKKRVDPSGTKEIMIRPLGSDKIEVTMPTVRKIEAENIWQLLVNTGSLEFRIVASAALHSDEIELARTQSMMPKTTDRMAPVVKDSKDRVVAKWVDIARVYDEKIQGYDKNSPFKFIPEARANLVRSANDGRIVSLLGIGFRGDRDSWGAQLTKWANENGHRGLEVLVVEPEEFQDVQGEYLQGIQIQPDDKGRNSVAFNLSPEGSIKMGSLTKANIGQPMGIVLDGEIHSAPNIESAIYDRGTITGNFSFKEVSDLMNKLQSGKLSVALNNAPISTDFIDSTLGSELKQRGIFAIGISLLLVLVFMVFYYRFSGIVASIALLLNLVLILALVMAIKYPLSLTGLAGLVLTVGMSVDANVLIFERIREELDRGAALRMAIRNGFDKATITIFDANLTTLITALVLYAFGTEQIKGFAVTLILGIVISMFTAIYVSRLIFDIWERKRWLSELKMTRMMDKTKFAFLQKVSITGFVSLALIVAGIGATFMLGSKILDQDLRGGSTARMIFKSATTIEEVRAKLDALEIVYEPTGEKVEFEVSSFSGVDDDSSMVGRKYKVDTNLPAWEGKKSGVKKYKQLDEILAETFKGQLLLHEVTFGATGTASVRTMESNAVVISKPDRTSRPAWNGVSRLAASVMPTSMLGYQENTPANPPASTPENTEEAPAATDQETPASNNNAQPPAAAPAGGIQDGGVPEVGSEQDPVANPAAPQGEGDAIVVRKLTVGPEILGKSLKALIAEEAIALGLNLSSESISVDSPDVVQGESPESTVSSEWTVEMRVPSEEDADEILKSWQTKFNETPYFPTVSSVGSQIAQKTTQDAAVAIIISLLGIVGYCWFRFQNLAFGLAAVIALIHDVLIVVGAIALSHWLANVLFFAGVVEFKISLEVIAALLTVIGYSLNDTIVVFDRIREVRGKRTEITEDMINTSISQTLSRTILTSVTTFIVVSILYAFGGDSIHGFSFALVVGVVVGTYSSIFVASPALLWLMNTVGLNPGEVEPEAAKA